MPVEAPDGTAARYEPKDDGSIKFRKITNPLSFGCDQI